MKLDIDEIKKEYEVFVEDPKERLGHYISEFSFHFLKVMQGAVEQLNSTLSQKLDDEYTKREPKFVPQVSEIPEDDGFIGPPLPVEPAE